jgi:hypothetical protein
MTIATEDNGLRPNPEWAAERMVIGFDAWFDGADAVSCDDCDGRSMTLQQYLNQDRAEYRPHRAVLWALLAVTAWAPLLLFHHHG